MLSITTSFWVLGTLTGIFAQGDTNSRNVSSCPGYALDSVSENETGLIAQLDLDGPPCDAFGTDIPNLTIEVAYETTSRLHVTIRDSDQKQFVVPQSVVERPALPTQSFADTSDLVFNYESAPFAFWITRRSDPLAAPLFDTRIGSLPATPIPPVVTTDNSTALDNFNLVFEDQFLQLTSALPLDANVYGLGEYYSETGFRRRIVEQGGSIQTLWARDVADPVDENMYGSHPLYLEHRYNESTTESHSHGVFLLSSSGGDILLLTPPDALQSLVQYRMIGGILDFYFLSGPSPQAVVEQYGELIGFPTWQPIWGFGFHLCRWGYHNVNETREQVENMRKANIPLEVMWNDIDLYLAFRDFTTDPGRFPGADVKAFIEELVRLPEARRFDLKLTMLLFNRQKIIRNVMFSPVSLRQVTDPRPNIDIPIVDAAIAKSVNATDLYEPYLDGSRRGVFVNNPDGTEYIGKVWPGYTVFPDWFADSTQAWWTEALGNWTEAGVEYSGIWLDMNEASSFCEGSCGTGQDLPALQVPPIVLPGTPGNLVTDYPECYDPEKFGPSGNITVNGTLTCQPSESPSRRELNSRQQANFDVNTPPYAIHNGDGPLSVGTIATNATHAGGITDIEVHNLYGLMEEKGTHLALQDLQPGKRPFLISRSTFPSAGKWTGHWLGDNFSKWQYLYLNIQGVLQFQLFQIPFVGADACGFNGNTDEELCNRWMQLSAFTPFYRNHNTMGAISQEPYRWESVANASRTAMAARYSLLPYWYALFANSSTRGTPPVRALFFEFPNEPELFGFDRQFMIGRHILVTPVLSPNVTSVEGIFPGRGQVVWRDFFTHEIIEASNGSVTLQAPLGHINVHIRDGSAILMHAKPAYTTEETRQGPFSLLVSLTSDRRALGSYYLDDGVSNPPGASTTLSIVASDNQLEIHADGGFNIGQPLEEITILGVSERPSEVTAQNDSIATWDYDEALQQLKLSNLTIDLNGNQVIMWSTSATSHSSFSPTFSDQSGM
ncbi:hypothetical protein PM082_008618 [Marasmius tenuissimus]|nr:hypothetical protein PM082_008618 [Marasmius tenuissimus]